MHRHFVALASALSLHAFADFAAAQGCQPPRGVNLESLYEYAQIAQIAYAPNESPSNSCNSLPIGERTVRALENPNVVPLQPGEYRDLDLPGIAEYEGEDGVRYVTCRNDGWAPRLAITWDRIRRTFSDSARDIVFRVVPVVLWAAPSMLTEEELGLVWLERSIGAPGPERLLAIRGTDPKRIKQIMASAMDLLGDSCVFEVAARIVSRAEAQWRGPLSVAGHSLGGSATQYVAESRNSQSNATSFSAYSFNGIGLANSSQRLPSLNSYYVDGEWVSALGRTLGRSQAGNVVRYVPPRDWPSISPAESARRHSLDTVQESLCECLMGRGSIDQSQP